MKKIEKSAIRNILNYKTKVRAHKSYCSQPAVPINQLADNSWPILFILAKGKNHSISDIEMRTFHIQYHGDHSICQYQMWYHI